ncbi:hypothetical protein [Moorena sp. SIO3B2]|nr:hypothetical protein [Moorena sp. SIO3B2]
MATFEIQIINNRATVTVKLFDYLPELPDFDTLAQSVIEKHAIDD